jgi:predicted nucleic acid-binding protein
MSFLIDTSILARLANQADTQYAVADRAILRLYLRGESLQVTAQNLVEFRNAATRPKNVNGLGLSIAETESQGARFEQLFPLLEEKPDIFLAWKAIVSAMGVTGKQVHDARLVAVCHVYSVTHLLTFNAAHFLRFASYGPGLTIVDPATV